MATKGQRRRQDRRSKRSILNNSDVKFIGSRKLGKLFYGAGVNRRSFNKRTENVESK